MNKLLVKLALLGCIASPLGARLREHNITQGRLQGGAGRGGAGKRARAEIADYVPVYRNIKLAVIEANAWRNRFAAVPLSPIAPRQSPTVARMKRSAIRERRDTLARVVVKVGGLGGE